MIRAGTHGAKEAVETLTKEAKSLAQEEHKNDLPEHLSVIVHIFIDVGKLAEDLSTANLLPDPDQLWTFVQDVSKLEPGVTISDCGTGHQAVDAKMKRELSLNQRYQDAADNRPDFYELYLENSHCKHLFLALGRDSEYYKILSTYADDAYTRQKTSLIKPTQGLPKEQNLPFHIVEFSTLNSIRRQTVSFEDATPKINGLAPRAEQDLNMANGKPPTGPRALTPTAPKFDVSSEFVPKANGMTSATSQSEPDPFQTSGNSTQSQTSRAAPASLQSMKRPPVEQAAPSSIAPTPSADVSTNVTTDPVEDSSSAGVVKLDTSSHSSHHSNNAEQLWESAETNSYAPDPISVPWGEETSQPAFQQFDGQAAYSKRNNNGPNRRQIRQGGSVGNGGGGFGGKQSRFNDKRLPRQFEGSWDEMVGSQGSSSTSPKPMTASISSSATSKSTDFAVLARQVVTKPEPNPQARPVLAPIALNKLDQRIDLKLPRPTPADEDTFRLRTANRHLCNEHHMRGKCSDIQCTFDHEEISDGVYLALRNKARTAPCNQGSRCRRHDCYLAHHCPSISRQSACGRPSCHFKYRGLHDVLDLDIVAMIEPPKQDGEPPKQDNEPPRQVEDLLVEGLI